MIHCSDWCFCPFNCANDANDAGASFMGDQQGGGSHSLSSPYSVHSVLSDTPRASRVTTPPRPVCRAYEVGVRAARVVVCAHLNAQVATGRHQWASIHAACAAVPTLHTCTCHQCAMLFTYAVPYQSCCHCPRAMPPHASHSAVALQSNAKPLCNGCTIYCAACSVEYCAADA